MPGDIETKPPALKSGSRRLFYFYLVLCLGLNDARSDEEDQLLIVCAYGCALEQVAQHRNVTQQRYLGNRHRVLSLNNAADHHRATVGHEDLGGCLLGDERRVTLHLTAKVWGRVFDVHVEE